MFDNHRSFLRDLYEKGVNQSFLSDEHKKITDAYAELLACAKSEVILVFDSLRSEILNTAIVLDEFSDFIGRDGKASVIVRSFSPKDIECSDFLNRLIYHLGVGSGRISLRLTRVEPHVVRNNRKYAVDIAVGDDRMYLLQLKRADVVCVGNMCDKNNVASLRRVYEMLSSGENSQKIDMTPYLNLIMA